MASSSYHKLDLSVVQYMFENPRGGLGRDLQKRGERVLRRARRNLEGAGLSGPRRIRTGRLKSSVKKELVVRPEGLSMRIGTTLYYARYVHDGTGIYGPKRRVIKPKRAKALVFRAAYGRKSGRYKGYVVVKSVKGMKPNPFLVEALPAFSG